MPGVAGMIACPSMTAGSRLEQRENSLKNQPMVLSHKTYQSLACSWLPHSSGKILYKNQ